MKLQHLEAKGQSKKGWNEGYLFYPAIAEHTVIVISFNSKSFSLEKISSIQSIHEQEPSKDFQLYNAFRFLDPSGRIWRLYPTKRELVKLACCVNTCTPNSDIHLRDCDCPV